MSDKQKVEFLLKEITAHDQEARAYEAWLVQRTHNLVRHESFWRPCRAVAEALLETETLSGRAVHKIIKASLETKPSPWADLPD